MSRTTRNEPGQILIITAVAMVILIVIAALVIDLGFSWMLRRQEQNAADPAALAAARFISDADPVTGAQTFDTAQGFAAACAYAKSNNIFEPSNANCDPALDPSGATLTVRYPPDASAGPQLVGQQGYVQVIISKQHPSFFGRIFGQSFATVRTQAIAARKQGSADTASLRVEDPSSCASMKVHGTALLHVYARPGVTEPGGFVYVNSNCASNTSDDDCDNGTGALKIDGTAGMWAPKTNVVGSCQSTSDEPHGVLDEAFSAIGDPLSGLRFPAVSPTGPGQTCGDGGTATTPTGPNAKGCGAGGGPNWRPSLDSSCPGLPSGYKCVVLRPGIFYGGWTIGSKLRVTLQPGIYVIAGGGITIGATGSLDSLNGGPTPAPVLIFNTDNPAATGCPAAGAGCQQDMDVTAGGALELRGLLPDAACPPVTAPTATGCPFGNMLFWYDQFGSQSASHAGDLAIEGGTQLYIAGTIYAPTANVSITGNSATNTNDDECPGVDGTQPLPGKTIAAVQIVSWTIDLGGTGDVCMPYDPAQLWKRNNKGLVH